MREDAMENGLMADQHVETETASGGRKSSVTTLENMLKKVSQSPLQSQRTQDGINGTPTRINPFYDYYLQSGSDGHVGHDGGAATTQDVDVDYVVAPPPEFQSSSPQSKSQTANVFSEPEAGTLTSGQNVIANPSQTQLAHTIQAERSDPFKGDVEDLPQTASAEEVNIFDTVDPFKSPLNNDLNDDLFGSMQPATGNPFPAATATGADLFRSAPTEIGPLDLDKESRPDRPSHEKDLFGPFPGKKVDVFSTSSTDTVDPFPSPIAKNLFQDVSGLDDPFGSASSKMHNPFDQNVSSGTPDIFPPPSSNSIFETTPSSPASVAAYSSPSAGSPAELESETSSPDIFRKKPVVPPPVPPKPSKNVPATVLTTPGGTEHQIFQPTPFSRARNLAMSSSRSPASMKLVKTDKRPPKPLPRTKPPKPESPPQPTIDPEPKGSPKPLQKPLPKPVMRLKPKTPESKKVQPENFDVFEDILLIGQERCVEDWPEDSPEVHPDFKPSGKFKLRRESLKSQMDSEDVNGEEDDGSGSSYKKREKRFSMSRLSRRDSKEKFSDDMEARSRTLPIPRKLSKDYLSDFQTSLGETEDGEQMDYKKKHLKTKVNQLLRRASTNSFVLGGKHGNGLSPQDDGIEKKSISKKDSIRRWSEGTALDTSTGEDEDGNLDEKRQKKLKIKFVPRRGFTISTEKTSNEPKGASGYTPRKSSKDKGFDENFGAHSMYTPRKKSQDVVLDEAVAQKMKSASSAEEPDDEELFMVEDYKLSKSKHKAKAAKGSGEADGFGYNSPQYADEFAEDEPAKRDHSKEMDDSEQDELETCKPKKHSKLKGFKKRKSKTSVLQGSAMDDESDFPPGATSSHLSEAARAEWYAAQMDERAKEGMEDGEEEEEGDTDSLMEWWNTVEQWDEVPSDEEDQILKEDESKSFSILADKVLRGLRVFNKVFTERAEVLWQSIITLCTIADDLSEFHQKAKIAGITGGTTTAVGGVTAIAGLALAPFTFGASLVITAVGVGVATAGGIASASAAISDNVNNSNDRKKVEVVLQDYEGHLLDIGKILHFINHGVYKLRGHPFLRSGTQHYSEDWETRRAVQMISLVDSPIMRATEITDAAVAMLQGLFKGMDKYFLKDSRELKKGCRKEIVAQIKEVANVLNNTIVDLNGIREELQESTGNI